MSPSSQSSDLREYTRIVRARKWESAAIMITVLAVTAALTVRQTPIYQGTAEVLVEPAQNLLNPLSAPQQPNLQTEQQVAQSQAVAQQVKKNLKLVPGVETVLSNLSVQVVADTNVLVIAYRSPDPAVAARVANGFAAAYINFRTQQAVSQLTAAAAGVKQQIDGVNQQLRTLNSKINGTSDESLRNALETQRDSLIGRLGILNQQYLSLQPNPAVQQSAGEVVQSATPPTTPVSPNKVRNGLLAVIVGALLGLGWAVIRERLDDRVKSREELEMRVGAQVIAAIPHVSNWRRNKDAMLVMRSDPKSPVAEAYRTLATNIQYLASRRPLSSIMVTSAMGSEGKTTTASNLAVALAQTGGRVLLVSADVRRPRLHEFFHIARSPGLTNLLRGEAHLSDVAQDVGRSNLKVVAAGPTPSNPAELLTGGRAAEVLRMMREVADFVILDAPPTLAVADASILAPLVDGTLCIVGAERSSRSTLGQIRTQLDNVGADVIGVVYNNFDPNKAAAYPYAYTYYREYYADDPKATNGHATAQRKKDLRRARREPATHGSFGFQPDSQGDPPVTVGEVPAGSDPSSPPANGAS